MGKKQFCRMCNKAHDFDEIPPYSDAWISHFRAGSDEANAQVKRYMKRHGLK